MTRRTCRVTIEIEDLAGTNVSVEVSRPMNHEQAILVAAIQAAQRAEAAMAEPADVDEQDPIRHCSWQEALPG